MWRPQGSRLRCVSTRTWCWMVPLRLLLGPGSVHCNDRIQKIQAPAAKEVLFGHSGVEFDRLLGRLGRGHRTTSIVLRCHGEVDASTVYLRFQRAAPAPLRE